MAEHHDSHPEEIRESLPDYIREGEKNTTAWYPYRTIICLWMGIDQLTSGTKANRYALGHCFKRLRDIYSEKNIGGNRRTSGHGTFEKECEQRGYPARTVRGWIADYEAILNGTFTEAQKRAARTKAKAEKAFDLGTAVGRLAQCASSLPDGLKDCSEDTLSQLKEVRSKVDRLITDAEYIRRSDKKSSRIKVSSRPQVESALRNLGVSVDAPVTVN